MRKDKKTIYVADDGTQFDNEDECVEYEKNVLNKIKYFRVYYDYDTESNMGYSRICNIAVVPSGFDNATDILINYVLQEICGGHYLKADFGGFGVVANFRFCDISKQSYHENGCENHGELYEKILISETPVNGFPKPFDYIEKWGLRKRCVKQNKQSKL